MQNIKCHLHNSIIKRYEISIHINIYKLQVLYYIINIEMLNNISIISRTRTICSKN